MGSIDFILFIGILLVIAGVIGIGINLFFMDEIDPIYNMAKQKCNETFKENTFFGGIVTGGYWCTEQIEKCAQDDLNRGGAREICQYFDGEDVFWHRESFFEEQGGVVE